MGKIITRMVQAIWQGVLASPFGAVAGAVVGFIVELLSGGAGLMGMGMWMGAALAAGTSATLRLIDDDWSLCGQLCDAFCPGSKGPTSNKPDPAPSPDTASQQERKASVSRTFGVTRESPVVLFLCTGNSARSQMAEALLKKYAGDRFAVYSAGLRPKGIHPLTVRVMSEMGIDISNQYSKDLRQFLGKLPVRVAISVCAPVEADCPTNWPSALSLLSWPVEDPAAYEGDEEERLARFRSVRDKLDRQIRSWLNDVGPSASLN